MTENFISVALFQDNKTRHRESKGRQCTVCVCVPVPTYRYLYMHSCIFKSTGSLYHDFVTLSSGLIFVLINLPEKRGEKILVLSFKYYADINLSTCLPGL